MLARTYLLLLVFLLAVPAWSQVEPEAEGGQTPAEDTQMMTPPPVSGMPYVNTAGSELRSNDLTTSVTVSPAYIDNVLAGYTSTPVSDVSYSIFPSVSFDRTTPRQQEHFSYSPYFTFYEPTTAFNSIDQNATVAFQYRFSPKVAFSLQDNFARTSNAYNSAYILSSAITGSTLTPTPEAIAPFAQQMINTVNGVLSYQFGLNAMIGGGGSFTTFDLPNPADSAGLYSSNGSGGNIFYNRRLSQLQYIGLAYQYARIVSNPANGVSETKTHTLLPFYTLYFNRASSLSISAGIQRLDVTEPGSPASGSWLPVGTGSVGWQGARGSFAASFSHTITDGEGLTGAYEADTVSASGGWALARNWSGELSVGYMSINPLKSLTLSSFQMGNTFTAGGSVAHPIGEHFSARFQYQRLHEAYNGIAVIRADPDSNRESGSITFQFRRPLGK